MQIKILRNLGTNEFPEMPYAEDEIRDVSESVAGVLIRRALAEPIPLKAVPPVELKAAEPITQKPHSAKAESIPKRGT